MKKIFLLLTAFFCLILSANAQRVLCGHSQLERLNLQKDPQYLQKMQAQEVAIQKWIRQYRANPNKASEVITIPTVIHILYLNDEQNISDEKALSQLDVLNKDFRLQNPDRVTIPDPFKPLAADVGIEFCLAKTDPQGNPTTGIIHHKVTSTVAPNGVLPLSVSEDTLNQMIADYLYEDIATQKTRQWDISKYYNIIVAPFAPGNPLLGIASFPGTAFDTLFNTVVRYDVFGTLPPLMEGYNKGRTTTHEAGHYFNLRHIWGDTLCGDDFVNDTPVQADKNQEGCPTFPKLSPVCNGGAGNGPDGDLYVNYMDYTPDSCTVMFTLGQKERMLAALNVGRPGLLTSTACRPSSRMNMQSGLNFSLYPNPAGGSFRLRCPNEAVGSVKVAVYSAVGQEILSERNYPVQNRSVDLDLSDQTDGIYYLKISSGNDLTVRKIVLNRN